MFPGIGGPSGGFFCNVGYTATYVYFRGNARALVGRVAGTFARYRTRSLPVSVVQKAEPVRHIGFCQVTSAVTGIRLLIGTNSSSGGGMQRDEL